MKTICDNCLNYSVSQCATMEICHAFIDRSTRFTNEMTKEYIQDRMTGEKTHCKEFKKLTA